jgi:hypothetical protein
MSENVTTAILPECWWLEKRVNRPKHDATSIEEKSSVPQPCEIAEHAMVLETQAGIPPIK